MAALPPELTYFCELDAAPLKDLFARPEVLEFLQTTRATLSLGIRDLSDERAEVVRCLNDAGVPVTAWLLLPKDQGYWFNLDNHPEARARYEQFKAWTAQHELAWAAIGLDIEPDFRISQMLSTHRWQALQIFIRNAINTPRLLGGARAYHALVDQIHADGYAVEAYQTPYIIDERKAKSRLIQRLTGIVDLREVDREVLMLYSSFLRPWGQGVLWSYASQANGIGIGLTGKGMEQGTILEARPLNWSELQTDLLLAHRHSDHLYIFSLEGCVQQGFLPQLKSFNWQQPVPIPYEAAERTQNLRTVFQRGLWLSGRPAWLLFGAALLVSALTLVGRRIKR